MDNTQALPAQQPGQSQPAPAAPAPYAAGTGSAPIPPDAAAFARLTYRERLALKRQDPDGYAALRG